jgi:phytoene dehydrogenase-like protein
MKIYVGRWDLLPEEWEGINGLYEKSEEEIAEEVKRQDELCFDEMDERYDNIGVYTPIEFEEEFNANKGDLNGGDYWIKIF